MTVNQNETKKLISNVLWTWAGRLGAIVVSLIFARLILHRLGREAFGIWEILMVMGSYYALADMGFNTACVKHLADYWAVGRRARFERYLTTSVLLYAFVAMVILAFGFIGSITIHHVFDIPQGLRGTTRLATFTYSFVVAVRFLVQPYRAALSAMERFDLLNILSVLTQSIASAACLGVLVLGWSLAGMAFVTLAVGILSAFATVVLVVRITGPGVIRFYRFDLGVVRSQVSFGGWVVLRRSATRIVNRGGVLLLGYLAGPAIVPFFSLADSLCGRMTGFLSGINRVVMPKASQLKASKDVDRTSQLVLRGSRCTVAVASIAAGGMALLSTGFLTLWLGSEFVHPTSTVVCYLSAVLVVVAPAAITRPVMTGHGRVRSLAVLEIIAAVVFVPLSTLCIRWWGPVGVAVALLLLRTLTEGFVVFRWVPQISRLDPMTYLRLGLLPGLLAAAIPFSATYLLSIGVDFQQPGGFVSGVLLYALVAAPSLALVGLDRQTRLTLLPKSPSRLRTSIGAVSTRAR